MIPRTLMASITSRSKSKSEPGYRGAPKLALENSKSRISRSSGASSRFLIFLTPSARAFGNRRNRENAGHVSGFSGLRVQIMFRQVLPTAGAGMPATHLTVGSSARATAKIISSERTKRSVREAIRGDPKRSVTLISVKRKRGPENTSQKKGKRTSHWGRPRDTPSYSRRNLPLGPPAVAFERLVFESPYM